MPHAFTLLAIDDDLALLKSLSRILKLEPLRLISTHEPQQSLPLLENNQIDLVLLDLKMPGMDGMTVLRTIKATFPTLPVILLTGHGSIQQAVQALKDGAEDFIEKPCSPATLIEKIRAFYPCATAPVDSAPQPGMAAADFPHLIGNSPVINELKALIVRIAKTDASILIHGETGTGKELVAQAIHHHSHRSHEIFVPVDCATINENILESELFGHRQGAFTGALYHKTGLFLAADKGSLFLDEIGEFHLDLQAKLLRTLQQRQVRPVGSDRAYAINIRLIAATNKNLERQVEQGHFREDLFYRLSTIVLEVPPLRARGADIAQLAQFFADKIAPSRQLKIDAQVLDRLNTYTWPGNVRELENVITRAVTLCQGNTITCLDLPEKLQICLPQYAAAHTPLQQHEKLTLERVLEQTGGNRRRAAEILQISEATLYRKLKKTGLSKLRD